jgi:hypothetical protein
VNTSGVVVMGMGVCMIDEHRRFLPLIEGCFIYRGNAHNTHHFPTRLVLAPMCVVWSMLIAVWVMLRGFVQLQQVGWADTGDKAC